MESCLSDYFWREDAGEEMEGKKISEGFEHSRWLLLYTNFKLKKNNWARATLTSNNLLLLAFCYQGNKYSSRKW